MNNFSNEYETLESLFISDCQSNANFLRHKKTGLEIFSLENADEENLFAFAFRTPILESTGVAHIMEHSVFCGSEKYPLKEPFVNLMNQSLYTFLNAMTYPDKTVYPASSTNRADFFHLLDVYADAVFFPLLKRETFLQEGRRFEISSDEKISLQGVVYNEMKGSYSSFYSIAFDEQFKSLLQNSCYAFDSGGDPKKIPDLTYDDFLNFHKNYYKPENCLLFFYGNIPLAEKISFLEKNFFPRIEKKLRSFETKISENKIETFKKKLQSFETVFPIKKEIFVNASAPNTNAKKSNAMLIFRTGFSNDMQSVMETNFLLQILCGNDSAPLSKILLDSKLGDDIVSGGSSESRVLSLYLGLSGVKKNNAKKVRSLIFETLEKIVQANFSSADIESALLALDFANREIVRNHGDPFSIELLERALNGWNYFSSPSQTLLYETACRNLKEKIASNKNYAKELVQKKLLENNERAFVVISPDKNFLKERERFEKKLLHEAEKKIDKEKLKLETKILHEAQERKESEDEKSCIPFLKKADLKNYLEPIETEIISSAPNDVPVFFNNEKTNGIVYVDVAFPCDALSARDYELLPSFCLCALNTGWHGKKWDECLKEASLCFGDISVHFTTGTTSSSSFAKKYIESVNDKNFLSRDWIIFSIKFTEEKLYEAFSLFSDALTHMDFSDTKRIASLLSESFNDMCASIIPHGSRYALLRSASNFSREGAIDEMMNGVHQLFVLKKLQKDNSLSEKFSAIAKTIFDSGAVLHVTSTDTKKIENDIFDFVKKTNLKKLSIGKQRPFENFSEFILKRNGAIEHLQLHSAISFLGESFLCDLKTRDEKAAVEALSQWMRSNILWEKFRVVGGAYGAAASFDWDANLFSLSTYRDPDAEHSLSLMKKCFDEMYEIHFSVNDVERSIVGSYGIRTRPKTPATRAYLGFKHKLYAITNEERNADLQALLRVDENTLHSVIEKLREKIAGANASIIAGGKIKNASERVKLPI